MLIIASMTGCAVDEPAPTPPTNDDLRLSIEDFAQVAMALDLAPVRDALGAIDRVGDGVCPNPEPAPDGTMAWSNDCVTTGGVTVFGTHRGRDLAWDDLPARAAEGVLGERLAGWSGEPHAVGSWYRSFVRFDLRGGGRIDLNGVYAAYALTWEDRSWVYREVGGPVHNNGTDGWDGLDPDIRWERIRVDGEQVVAMEGYIGGLQGTYGAVSVDLLVEDALSGTITLRDADGVWTEVWFDDALCGRATRAGVDLGDVCPALTAWGVP